MASVPAFSTFSAISELFVTAAVFYFFSMALRRNDFRWALIGITIAFETLFNITYMASRLGQSAQANLPQPAWVVALLAGHGTLSLAMFLGLIAFILIAYRRHRVEGINLFATRRRLTYAFLALWTLSVLSGELIYVLQLSGTLRL